MSDDVVSRAEYDAMSGHAREWRKHAIDLRRRINHEEREDRAPRICIDSHITAQEPCTKCGQSVGLTDDERHIRKSISRHCRTRGWDWRKAFDAFLVEICGCQGVQRDETLFDDAGA